MSSCMALAHEVWTSFLFYRLTYSNDTYILNSDFTKVFSEYDGNTKAIQNVLRPRQ